MGVIKIAELQPHSRHADEVLHELNTSVTGLSREEAAERLVRFGRNTLPRAKPLSIQMLFLRQFLSPLIYVLLAAAAVSFILEKMTDAAFILAVLLINAIIGTAQEYSAERNIESLRDLVRTYARVVREGESIEMDAEECVPGDVVLLEEGMKVPADLRLLETHALEVDEALLTGESTPVSKDASAVLKWNAALGDRVNMAFAGTIVTRGRGRGVVVATGRETELGRLAGSLTDVESAKPPLTRRMEVFSGNIAKAVLIAVLLIIAIEVRRGADFAQVFVQSVALAVSAIPEGLPVALTVVLAVAVNRMARRNVIVRRMIAVETLGSCDFIASDKTGTLTMNELTARLIAVPGYGYMEVTGEGISPEGEIRTAHGKPTEEEDLLIKRIVTAAALCNEAFFGMRDGRWIHHGDTVDVALLVMAHKVGVRQADIASKYPLVTQIPFASERKFAATLNRADGRLLAFVKGAPETLLEMCDRMVTIDGEAPLDRDAIERCASDMANNGYRVLAVADGLLESDDEFSDKRLRGLTFLGLIGMIDPLRPEAKPAVTRCRKAGIQVAMVTGDHPITALAIARELEMARSMDEVITGPELKKAELIGEDAFDELVRRARVFARVEPRQKLDIIQSLIRLGHTVAVTGDGANDAPAMRAAHVGVAMGKSGTDIAKESAEIVITDDNFASIVAGVEEGRVAYSNVRKVIFLLVSTGAAEIVLFFLALFAAVPLPLLAVQLLWLNLVTNGIQHIGLALEPAEGDEMKRPPRPQREGIFNRMMIERILLSSIVMGGIAFMLYRHMLTTGSSLYEARNSIMLLMVLFENIQVFNSRSELRSAFSLSPLRNPILFFGTIGAQMVHIIAMYTPWLSNVLNIGPVSPEHWARLLALALTILVTMEAYKMVRRRIAVS
ncbi:HAD-IC family P-type ATPase [Methanothrix sp.]|uniref:cation-translocating P-type ATPase n=1 Tax=Methanothrix sp. TaxID=90426 RepID=UPI002B8C0A39|nr:HAD-IC family P-type ATPase [Methanothrix sp.]HOK58122.1 HAD-IC family P-type ATPase [Methanothrix sp.]HOL43026.1 HAD-IC family P-type ATPase [Methanothrix sp.]HPO88029.1 HAD-IC family P-type ATPase [Methanothrix sp.]